MWARIVSGNRAANCKGVIRAKRFRQILAGLRSDTSQARAPGVTPTAAQIKPARLAVAADVQAIVFTD